MIVHIEIGSVPMHERPGDRRRTVVYHAWAESVNEDVERVMDVNYAAQVVGKICKDGSPVVEGRPTEPGYRGEFAVVMRVTRTHKRVSHYSADYMRLNAHCDSKVSEQGMCIYREIKRVLRESRESLREARERKRAERERKSADGEQSCENCEQKGE